MKTYLSKLSISLAILTSLIACKKNEQFLKNESNAMQSEKLKFKPATVTNSMGKYFEAIDTICNPYTMHTTKLDLSRVTPEMWIEEVSDRNLVISPGDYGYGQHGFFVVNPNPTSWFSNWNKSPYVEEENPIVLVPQDIQDTLLLSKSCYVFGFEMSAKQSKTTNKPVTYRVIYWVSSIKDPSQRIVGSLENTVSSPSGAHLFAVKSEIPFDRVTIMYSPTSENTGQNAIANIRYVTSKEIFDKYK